MTRRELIGVLKAQKKGHKIGVKRWFRSYTMKPADSISDTEPSDTAAKRIKFRVTSGPDGQVLLSQIETPAVKKFAGELKTNSKSEFDDLPDFDSWVSWFEAQIAISKALELGETN